MKKIIIAGSPCAGKSTVSEILSKKYGYQLIKVDDFLGKHIEDATKDQPILYRWQTTPWHELFSRSAELQHKEELQFYQEEWLLLLNDIDENIISDKVLIEGCAMMPDLVETLEEDIKVVYMVPEEAFQRMHYEKRTWAFDMLRDAEDPQEAFDRWMLRDIEFAKTIKQAAEERGFPTIVIDGSKSVEVIVEELEQVLF